MNPVIGIFVTIGYYQAAQYGFAACTARLSVWRSPMGVVQISSRRNPHPQATYPMIEIACSDKIQWLEQRHVELLDELDSLNSRLEQTLTSFTKQNDEARMTKHE